MTRVKNKILAYGLSAAMLVGMVPATTLNVAAITSDVTVPFSSSVSFTTSDGTTHTSTTYRIPSIVTLADGTMVAAADARYNTNYDGGGLDTLVAYSYNNGGTWSYTAANYLPDNGDSYNAKSTAFIDPSLVVAPDGNRVYMLTDLYPGGIALNGSGNTQPSTDVGFDDNGYLKLSKGTSSSYDYYLKDGKIYDYSTNTDQGYTVDSYFYVYKDGVKVGNLFYSDTTYTTAAANSDTNSNKAVADDTNALEGGTAAAANAAAVTSENAYAVSDENVTDGAVEEPAAENSEAAASESGSAEEAPAEEAAAEAGTEDAEALEAAEAVAAEAVAGEGAVENAEEAGQDAGQVDGEAAEVPSEVPSSDAETGDNSAADSTPDATQGEGTADGEAAAEGTDNGETVSPSGTEEVTPAATKDASTTDAALNAAALADGLTADTAKAANAAANDNDAFKVVPTGYLYLTYSDDGGASWSAPTLLNLKISGENVCLVGPGAGLTTSDGWMIFPVYSYSGSTESQVTGFIYSTDGGSTWQRSSSCGVSWSSEAAAVEIAGTSTIRFFYRNGNSTLCYVDYDRSTSNWGSSVNTGTPINSNTELSAISYSKTADDGKQIILISAPTGATRDAGSSNNNEAYRKNGTVFVEEVGTDGSLTLKNKIEISSDYFVYSCMTERSDGSVALLYENSWSGWGVGGTCGMALALISSSDIAGSAVSYDESTTQYVELGTGDYSSEYSLTGSTAADGWHLSSDGKAAYKIYESGPSTYSSISSGTSFKISCGDYWMTLSGSTLGVTTDYSQAAVWTASTSSADSSAFLIKSGSYYLCHSGNSLTATTSNSTRYKHNSWYYSSDYGLYYLTASSNSYSTPNRYLSFNGSSWEYATSTTSYSLARSSTDTSGKSVKFYALDTTTATTVSLGRTDFVLLINAKTTEVNKYVTTSSNTTLNAISDLGLVSSVTNDTADSELLNLVPTYTVNYEITSGEDSIYLTESEIAPEQLVTVGGKGEEYGISEVTATVTNASSGNAVGTVKYAVMVEEQEVTDAKNVYVPVGETATIEGLEGTIITTRSDGTNILDINTATVAPDSGTLNNGSITVTGVSVGKTQVQVGTVMFNIYVVNKNTQKTSSKYLYLYIDEMEHTRVYYTINGSTFQEVDGTGVLIDQTFNGGFHIMFFAAPEDGYALSEMSMEYNTTDPDGTMTKTTDFYAMSNGTREDGSDSDAWPLTDADATTVPSSGSDSAWKTINGTKHGFRWSLIEGNITLDQMRALFTMALAQGADGATNMTKNSTEGGYYHWKFNSEKLPTLNKKLVSYERDGVVYDYTAGDTLKFGDVLTYQFDVISYSTNISYTGITLSDDQIGWTNTIDDGTINTIGVYSYTATYTVTKDDLAKYEGGYFKNTAALDYTYKSSYSAGTTEAESMASITAPIAGIVTYAWPDGLPDGIVKDTTNYPLPSSYAAAAGEKFNVATYTGNKTYDVVEDGITKGTWEYKDYWDYDGSQYTGDTEFTMPELESVVFVGHWEYTPATQYTVSYEWAADSATPPDMTPPDSNKYYKGETYTVNDWYTEGYTYETDEATYTFSGWMIDGTVQTGEKTIEEADVTYVGKWTKVSKTTSLTITKQGASTVDAGQVFMFKVTGGDEANPIDITVSIEGNGSVTVDGLLNGKTYTVEEISDWSWRYNASTWTYTTSTEGSGSTGTGATAQIVMGESDNSLTYTNSRKTENKWLDGNSSCTNVFN